MKEYNAHLINDFLNQHPELSSTEYRVAYYTVHSDYGRKKNGLFWEGASSISKRIHIDRRTITKTWHMMCDRGWLRDTGKKYGRATVWQIRYGELQKDAEFWKEQSRRTQNLPEFMQELLAEEEIGCTSGRPRLYAECSTGGVCMSTTLPKEST